ncbi:hypothetical protein FAZ19_01690 [Sphingobacterium alkalisoli]|uniref:DUF4374 domain-containing protein n=1 Tax=Sphingobacterium alkalisoli TaxID=1874115 RepID=A0A4U0H8B1_9SPHI|nr:hypothetical protein [Sphingobacterium alkalisoli]TJY67998.1 hypothetical protein FAZ19_01690 [Sphingobacterium alkalisoli]GGH09787.1 hypothetical protein GCM10011418_07930 [Sphingobacterium alkalisoli]
MKKNLLKSALYATALLALTFTGCNKDNGPDTEPEDTDTRWITLTAAMSLGADGAPPTTTNGNGGTLAYGITHGQAIDPNFELDIYPAGKGLMLTSPRTSRVQASEDGKILFDIQYTGADAGLFQSYQVAGQGNYTTFGREVNTQDILGTQPRWIKSTDELGVGVNSDGATLTTEYDGTGLTATFKRNVRTVRVAILDLKDPGMINTRQVPVSFPDELAVQGYTLGRTDVPLINAAKTKIYIGCAVSKIDPTKPSLNLDGTVAWTTNDNTNNTIGTVTLVLDYPTLRNPEFIISNVAKGNNNGYRTKTQHVGTDGHIYQAVATNGFQILRISKETDKYDDTYEFNLNTALGTTGTSIRGFRYIKDGKAIVLYHETDKSGGYIALVDLNAKTAKKLATEIEADTELNFGQHQNVGVVGDYAYIPLTPAGKAGNVYVVNWKEETIVKGAKLTGYAFARYIGSY